METVMNKPTTATPRPAKEDLQAPKDSDSVSRRVAEELHERIDQAADKGEKLERSLHEQGVLAQGKTHELTSSLSRIARDNPWAVVGGSVALGVLIGALTRRR